MRLTVGRFSVPYDHVPEELQPEWVKAFRDCMRPVLDPDRASIESAVFFADNKTGVAIMASRRR